MLGWFRRKGDPKAQLMKVLGDAQLPTFPAVVLEALSLLRNPDAQLVDISNKLVVDPGVSVKLLGVSNSAGFSLRQPVMNVEHAVALLGRSTVEGLLLGFAISAALPHNSHTPKNFWTLAARRAVTARSLAQLLHPATQSESFTAALLQDMSLPLLANTRGAEYREVLAAANAGEQALETLERELYGWDHAHVSGWMCDSWGFPQQLTNAIGSHHEEPELGVPLSVALVSGFGATPEAEHESLIERLHSTHGLNRDAVSALLQKAAEDAGEVAALFRN